MLFELYNTITEELYHNEDMTADEAKEKNRIYYNQNEPYRWVPVTKTACIHIGDNE